MKIKINGSGGNLLNLLEKISKEFDGTTAQAGWFESSKYPDGQQVAYIAAIHEFGAPEVNIPARPFIRPAIEKNKKAWGDVVKNGVKKFIRGQETSTGIFEDVGLLMAADISASINSVVSPPLKHSTILARSRRYADKKVTKSLEKPLNDTGLMLASLTNVVNKE